MQKHIAQHKEEHPEMEHKERFKIVAQLWKTSPANPKNQPGGAGQEEHEEGGTTEAAQGEKPGQAQEQKSEEEPQEEAPKA
ncbi:hypothetical protein JKP88DRAFT_221759 [Tribonema minus]|uniref:HMG box domain-containing protein n=1 Tax=Tribonema minus TaxID=303371 RepID=A0A835YUX4_9STRA|nr:hypothetical protein JKP88DRAFT_221759 [Tribonema minus]